MEDMEGFSEGYRIMRDRDGDSITGTVQVKCISFLLVLKILSILSLKLVSRSECLF